MLLHNKTFARIFLIQQNYVAFVNRQISNDISNYEIGWVKDSYLLFHSRNHLQVFSICVTPKCFIISATFCFTSFNVNAVFKLPVVAKERGLIFFVVEQFLDINSEVLSTLFSMLSFPSSVYQCFLFDFNHVMNVSSAF